MSETQPIFNHEAERCLLGSAILSDCSVNAASHQQAQRWIMAFARPEWFFVPAHRRICEAIRKLAELGFVADLVSIKRELAADIGEVGGVEYLLQICDAVPSGTSVAHYGRLVHESYVRREIVNRSAKLAELASDCPIDGLGALIGEAGLLGKNLSLGHESIWEAKDIALTERGHEGVATGFWQIDKINFCHGYPKGGLSVWLGPPGNGKTTAMLQSMIGHADPFDERVAFVTLEMSREEITRTWIKMACGYFKLPTSQDLFRQETEQAKFRAAEAKIRTLNPTIIEPTGEGRCIEAICGTVESMHLQSPLKLVMLDYWQLVQTAKPFRDNRVRELDYIAEQLKDLAKALNVPIVLAAQNTGANTVKSARELTIKGSKALEEAAALIIGLVRDENDSPDCAVLKNRFGGAKPKIELTYDKRFARFQEPEAK